MNLDRWAARVYDENDIGRGIATTLAAVGGLSTYLYWGDWVVAAFVAIIVFPVSRIATSAIHSRWARSRERRRTKGQMEDLFESLGSEERATVQAFVWHGGSVMTWSECNHSSHVSVAGIESLLNRDLVYMTMTADLASEAFSLDTQLFDYAQKVLPNEPI